MPPADSIFSRALAENAVRETVSFFVRSPVAEDLDVVFVFLTDHDLALASSGVTSVPASKRSSAATLTGCGERAERADRHRVLRRVAAQLAEPHVDRHLAALEAGAHLLRARARLLALDAAARVAALAGAEAAADALAVLPRLGGLEGARGSAARPSDAPRPSRGGAPCGACRRAAGSPLLGAILPILPRPSARSVPRWRSLWPIWLRTCVILTLGISSPRLLRRAGGCAASALAATRPARRSGAPRLRRAARHGSTSCDRQPRARATSSGRRRLLAARRRSPSPC